MVSQAGELEAAAANLWPGTPAINLAGLPGRFFFKTNTQITNLFFREAKCMMR